MRTDKEDAKPTEYCRHKSVKKWVDGAGSTETNMSTSNSSNQRK
jgi:hypothetical protein